MQRARHFCIEVVTQLNLEFYYLHLQVLLQLISMVTQYILVCIYYVEVVELVIIDEISIFSSKLFYQTHKRLNEIFSPGQDITFGGKSVLGEGNLCQLPPVRAKTVFSFNDTETMKGFLSMDLWRKFKLAELD